MTKTSTAICLFRRGEYGKAYSIFRTFRMGFGKSDMRTIEIASDCLNGHTNYYQQLGIDVQEVLSNAKRVIKDRYNLI